MFILQGGSAASANILRSLPQVITAIGGLGTAAFGLVDSTKTLPFGGVNRIGFKGIRRVVQSLTPGTPSQGLSQAKIIDTLKANWFNGKDLSSQKAIAKSLIKQGLTAENAPALAKLTGVNETVLKNVAIKIAAGAALIQTVPATAPAQDGADAAQPAQSESDVYGRFDFVLTALLDDAYQHSDQTYTNWTRVIAMFFAVVLAFVGGWTLFAFPPHTKDRIWDYFHAYWNTVQMWEAVLVGVLATPLAPIAKDLSSALATAVNTMQAVKK